MKCNPPHKATWPNGYRGFTLVELIVASAAMTVTMLAVYTVFRQTLAVEGRTSLQWSQQGSAEVVADHIASTIENCVNLPKIPAVQARENRRNGLTFTCTFMAPFDPYAVSPTIQQRQYRWTAPAGEGSGELTVKTALLSGVKFVTDVPQPISLDADGASSDWTQIQPRVIANSIDGLSVSFRKVDEVDGAWKRSWNGAVGGVAVKIQVKVGDQSAERIVVPKADAVLVKGRG